ncbi:hypothetical protein NGM99_13950 [Mesorhizobium sp. RP14(2022)]|uniref:YozE SAM-like domain-containing protein n=1 Tax=Mesorhizobium liriopis TaxID=2953882 RepID=A0ABT1C7R2_9HYPH|nr:hypothetical protein [Mesorhizobium liriopis]MCO6050883.1 hypothetical protein [Mesorhizobium liriopis]
MFSSLPAIMARRVTEEVPGDVSEDDFLAWVEANFPNATGDDWEQTLTIMNEMDALQASDFEASARFFWETLQ